MGLHELAINAIKHGALSVEQGRVHVSWVANKDGGLTLKWTEKGGPKIRNTPERRGFGMELLETLFAAENQRFEWRTDGLEVEI